MGETKSPAKKSTSSANDGRRRRSDEKSRRDSDETPAPKRTRTTDSSAAVKDKENSDRRRRRDEDEKNGDGDVAKKETPTKKENVEKGEVKPREPTKRELEIQRLMSEGKLDMAGDEDEPVWSHALAQGEKATQQCPYLDTICRDVLDFDFEKLCSVSLSHLNVYACMVCGKYFQGRGTSTHAYMHALDTNHHVFLNLQTLRFYCLPDNYEIHDPSLADIQYVCKPTFTKQQIVQLEKQNRPVRAHDDSTYFSGVVGLNNIKANDYTNVVLHALSHVRPLRNYFLREENYANLRRPPGDKLQAMSQRFGELVRKLWNPKAFKAHVSPHEMLQAVVVCSEKRFQIIKQGDAAEFLNFVLNTLHTALNGTKKDNSSIIYKCFRGRMKAYTRKVLPVDATEEDRQRMMQTNEYLEKTEDLPYLFLTLDLPPAPLYRDEQMQNIIPQVPLSVLFQKFNGQTEKEYKTYNENFMKRFEITLLPEYLIVTYKRFHKNQWYVEKNPTIVNFPISNVDLFDCLSEEARQSHKYTTYDLLANVVHDGAPEKGTYRAQVLHAATSKWFELEDLHVKEILPQMITLAESYIQIWKLNKEKTREERLNETPAEQLSGMA